jgi:hypothetical protein
MKLYVQQSKYVSNQKTFEKKKRIGKTMKVKMFYISMILVLVLSLVAAPAMAQKKVAADTAGAPTTTWEVQPVYFVGNLVCGNFSAEWIHAKYNVGETDPEKESFGNGDFEVEGGMITITNFDGKYFDFDATMPISAVFVKAGNGGNFFLYDGPVTYMGTNYPAGPGAKTYDTDLHGPVAPNGKVREISHVSFCWDLDEKTETAFAYGGGTNANDEDGTTCFENLGDISRWGWSMGPLGEETYEWDFYTGAALCDISKGTKVGTVTVVYNNGTVDVTYNMKEGYTANPTHVYAGITPLPLDKKGDPTVAPGQYYIAENLSGDIYVIVHAEVTGPFN